MVVGGRELIDTLWNVNYITEEQAQKINEELIDTLWNVNLTLSKFLTFSMRINRYIMECKYGHCKYDCRQQNELIDTLWNVNV